MKIDPITSDKSYDKALLDCAAPDKGEVAAAFQCFLKTLGLNTSEQNLHDTANRVALAFTEELFTGLYNAPPTIKSFPTVVTSPLHIVARKDITVRSLCAHHFMPISGKAEILAVFVPDKNSTVNVPGLSKYDRVVEHFSRRPQLQERITEQVASYLFENMEVVALAVKVTARHHCMAHRGVLGHPESETVTCATRRSQRFLDPVVSTTISTLLGNFYASSISCS